MVSYSSKTLTPKKILDFNCSLKSRWPTLFLWQLHIAAGGSCLKHWDKCPKRCNIITLKCTWCSRLSADLKKEPNKSNPDDCSFSSLLAFILAFMSVTHTHLCFLIAFLEWRTFFWIAMKSRFTKTLKLHRQKESSVTSWSDHLCCKLFIIHSVSSFSQISLQLQPLFPIRNRCSWSVIPEQPPTLKHALTKNRHLKLFNSHIRCWITEQVRNEDHSVFSKDSQSSKSICRNWTVCFSVANLHTCILSLTISPMLCGTCLDAAAEKSNYKHLPGQHGCLMLVAKLHRGL